jgi:hypothetical protein
MARKRPANAEDREAHLRPCATCERMTRPSWMFKSEEPDTVVRASGTECVTCYQFGEVKNPTAIKKPVPEDTPERNEKDQRRYDHTVTALEKFYARRNERLARNTTANNRRVLNGFRGTWNGVQHPRDGDRGAGDHLRAVAGESRREA